MIEGTFTMMSALNVTHMATDAVGTRSLEPNSGTMHLVVARDIGCCSMVRTLLALEDGQAEDLPFVETIAATAFRLEPFENRGIFSLDGEVRV